jgi:subtilisin
MNLENPSNMKIPHYILIIISICFLTPSLFALESQILNQLKTTTHIPLIVTLHDPVKTDIKKHRQGRRITDKQRRHLIAQSQAAVLSALSSTRSKKSVDFKLKRQYHYIPAFAGQFSPQAITILQNHPQVASIQQDKQYEFFLADSKPQINVDAVHRLFYTGKGVTIAILDSGIDTNHPDIADNIVAQHCFSQASCPPFGTNESTFAEDDIYGMGHGTFVAGTLTGPQGIAPDANIVAIKVSSQIGIFSAPLQSDILAALDWIRLNFSTQPVQIITLSLGSGTYSNLCDDDDPATSSIFKQLRELGIAIFVGVGNDGLTNQIASPACLNDAIAVGATNMAGQVADFSNSNHLVDILGPGENITASMIGGGQITKTGTSFSTPIVAGVAALMLEAYPTFTPNTIALLMEKTGVMLTDPKNGLTFPSLDALAAIKLLPAETVAFDFLKKGAILPETNGTITIEVNRLWSAAGRVSIDYLTQDDSATAGEDYIATAGTLVWEDGDIRPKSFSVTILDDNHPESFEEAFSIFLHNPVGNQIAHTPKQSKITLTDNDGAGQLEITGISDYTQLNDFFVHQINHGIEENINTLKIEVARQNGDQGSVSVNYSTEEGTAKAGEDYTSTVGTLTWMHGDKENKSFNIPLLDDNLFEGKETFNVVLSTPTGGAILDEKVKSLVAIGDNEYSLGIADSSLETKQADLPHPFWNSGITGLRESAIFTNAQLARTGAHFIFFGGLPLPTAAFATQTFLIPKEASRLNFWLKIPPPASGNPADILRVLIDGKEHFTITSEKAIEYIDYKLVTLDIHDYADGKLHDLFFYSEVYGHDTATTAFLIDDIELVQQEAGLLQFKQKDININENSGLITLEVNRLLGHQGQITVNYITSNDTAQSHIDYLPVTGTLTWEESDTRPQSFTVPIIDNKYYGKDKTFKVSLFNPTGGASTALAEPATVTIINDDSPLATISDGGFELGTPNPVWEERDSFGISPICSDSLCGDPELRTQAYSGEYFAWFGSASPSRIESLEQSLIIPTGTTALSFWLQIPTAESPGYLQISIDNQPIFGVTEADAAKYPEYTQITTDITAYADNQLHQLRFDANVIGGGAMRFFVDEVALVSTPCTPGVTPIPEAPKLQVTTSEDYAQAIWTTVKNAEGYILGYAPYSAILTQNTLSQITTLDLGLKNKILYQLTPGTALYVAVQAYNCSGKSAYSKPNVVIIPTF